jgi:hypothetical protein
MMAEGREIRWIRSLLNELYDMRSIFKLQKDTLKMDLSGVTVRLQGPAIFFDYPGDFKIPLKSTTVAHSSSSEWRLEYS